MCGATSYRPVLDRDGTGAMRATGLYRCSGCSVVFADPRAWRESGADDAPPSASPVASTGVGGIPMPVDQHAAAPVQPRAPDLRTYGTVPSGTTR
jgi:hypothetical protein